MRHVTEALTTVADVQSVSVSLEDKTATVTSGDVLSVVAVQAAIEEAGYSLRA